MSWSDVPEELRRVFCCPVCYGDLVEELPVLHCVDCASRWPIINGQVPCFTERVYQVGQARTQRVFRKGFLRQGRIYRWSRDRLWQAHELLRCAIMGADQRWEEELHKARVIEDGVVEDLLSTHTHLPVSMAVELGVGSRDGSRYAGRVAKRVISSDIFYDEQVARAYLNDTRTEYSVISADSLPFKKESIDLLLTSHVVEHFPDKQRAMSNIHRVLRPGGLAVHVVPTTSAHILRHVRASIVNPLTLTPYFTGGIHGEYEGIIEELRLNSVKAWRNFFAVKGFRVVAERSGGVLCMRPLSIRLSSKIANSFRIYGSHVYLTRKVPAN